MSSDNPRKTLRNCVVCGISFTAWRQVPSPICSQACKEMRRAAKRKTVTMPCTACGLVVMLSGRRGLEQARNRVFCSDSCRTETLSRENSERMASTNRRHASKRMTEHNPMRSEVTRGKVSASLRAMNHQPRVRGGNGTGPSPMEARLMDALPNGWTLSLAVPTRQPPGAGYPSHYKIDIASPDLMIAAEVDGQSHCALSRQGQDAKKQALLESLGWTVLRFTNEEIATDLDSCVRTILSTTSKLKAITTTSSTEY